MELIRLKNALEYLKNNNKFDNKNMLNNFGFETIEEFNKKNKFIFKKNKIIKPNEKNIIKIGKVKNGEDYILSFKNLSAHLLIVDQEQKILKNIISEILKKEKKVFALLNKESLFIELNKFCEDNNIKKYSQSEKFCFSIEYSSEIMIYILNCLIKENFKPFTQLFVENYFVKHKKINKYERIYFSASFVEEIINYITINSANDSIEFNYFSELINGLKQLKLSLNDNYSGDFDIANRMENRENTILFSKDEYMTKIIHVLNKIDNIREFRKQEDEIYNNKREQYFMSLPKVSDFEEFTSISLPLQCKTLSKSILIYDDFMDSITYKISLNCATSIIRMFSDKNSFIVDSRNKISLLNFM